MALFGSDAPDHPMAGIRQAKKLITELPAYDSIKALDEVTFWLDSIGHTEGFRVDHRFELIDLLDHAARGHQRKLAQDYLATDRQEKFRENRLWNTLFNFWKHLGDAYGQCVEQFQSGASGTDAIRKKLPAIVARALRALTLQLDSRDGARAARWGVLLGDDALARCHGQGNCTEVCPMGLAPTASIIRLRRLGLSRLLGGSG